MRSGVFGQLDLALSSFAAAEPTVNVDEVRAELLELLERAKSAIDEPPWTPREHRYHRVVFPQMANWLPDEEAAELRLAFAQEAARIDLLFG